MVGDLTKDVLEGTFYLIEHPEQESAFHYGLEGSYPRWGTAQDLGSAALAMSAEELAPWRRPAASVQEFLAYVSRLPIWDSEPNYEDVSGLLRAVATSVFRGINDPFANSLLSTHDLSSRLVALDFPEGHRYFQMKLNQQLSVVEDFIGWVVAKRIRIEPQLLGYEAFATAIKVLRSRQHKVHFVTTNYDCNIERLLEKLRVAFHDGFEARAVYDDDERPWRLGNNLKFFSRRTSAVVKLHGSINWFVCHDMNGSGAATYAVSPCDLPPEAGFGTYLREGPWHFTPMHSPEMLRGSVSKAHEYSYGIYAQLLSAFETILDRADAVVVAGFGWNDEGLATRLLRFAHSNGKRLLVVDGSQPIPAVARVPDLDARAIGDVGQGRHVSVYRKHMSALEPTELLPLILELMQ